jgi:hypothetical protein
MREVQLPDALRFGSYDRIQPGVLAGPRQLHIQPVDILGPGEAHERSSTGQPLGAMPGGGIGQIHPPVALPAAATVQIRPGQRDLFVIGAVQADGQGAGVGVEGDDCAAAAVGHPQLADGVVAADDPVPDSQLTVLDPQPL